MKSVVICGSQRFNDEINHFAARLRKLGASQVFTPNFKYARKNFLESDERDRLQSRTYRKQLSAFVLEHFDRIRKADICFVYNKDGYLGVNTTLEIGFAHGREMVIYSLERESDAEEGGEICREILFSEVVGTPEELYKILE